MWVKKSFVYMLSEQVGNFSNCIKISSFPYNIFSFWLLVYHFG